MTSMWRQGSGAPHQEGIKTLFRWGPAPYTGFMADLWVVLTIIGFFAVCVAMVWGCDRIIGPDEASDLGSDELESAPEPAETAEAVR